MPAVLAYRDLALRMVASACRLVEARLLDLATGESRADPELDAQVLSAFGEAFNNVALHSYQGHGGEVEIDIETGPQALVIRIQDRGEPFDLDRVPVPDLDALPESGLGLYIMRACMDEVSYVPGPPNVLTLTRRLVRATRDGQVLAERAADE